MKKRGRGIAPAINTALPRSSDLHQILEHRVEAAEWVNPKIVVPIHWGTYPILAGNPAQFKAALDARGF